MSIPKDTPTSTPSSTPVVDSLRLEVDAPARTRAGGTATLTFRVRNTGSAPLTLYLRGREIVFDLVIRDHRGVIVWRRLEGQMIPAIVRVVTLHSEQQLEFHDSWHPSRDLPPGAYTVVGELLRDEPEPLRSPTASMEVFR